MKTDESDIAFALCIDNRDCEDLEKGKVYQVLDDKRAIAEGYLRIIDDSAEDYLYPSSYFVALDLPKKARDALTVCVQREAVGLRVFREHPPPPVSLRRSNWRSATNASISLSSTLGQFRELSTTRLGKMESHFARGGSGQAPLPIGYMRDADDFAKALNRAHELVPLLTQTYNNLNRYAKARFGHEEESWPQDLLIRH